MGNSLFEDNAEFGYGMLLAQKAIRDGLKAKVEDVVANVTMQTLKLLVRNGWILSHAVLPTVQQQINWLQLLRLADATSKRHSYTERLPC